MGERAVIAGVQGGVQGGRQRGRRLEHGEKLLGLLQVKQYKHLTIRTSKGRWCLLNFNFGRRGIVKMLAYFSPVQCTITLAAAFASVP